MKSLTKYENNIIQSQFKRLDEFSKIALNNSELARKLFKVKLEYKIPKVKNYD